MHSNDRQVNFAQTQSAFGEDLFDDWFAFPDFRDLDRTERKLYGRHADRMELNNGYLIVSANKGLDKDEKDKKGKLIRQERYSGSMQRSFYVGENITEEDIKASFKHGVLLCLRV